MKKIYGLLAGLMLVSMSGCKKTTEGWLKDNNLNVIAPTGAATLAFLDFIEEDEFETNSTVSNIAASMASGTNKVAVMDLVGGVNAIKKGAQYKLASVITFGNFYIYSTGNDDNAIMEDSDYIVGFGNNTSTPTYIFNNLFSGVSVDDYLPGISDLVPFVKLGTHNDKKVDYFLVAEPALTQIISDKTAATSEKGSVYANLQDLWKEKYGNESILGAAIFIKDKSIENDFSKVSKFLNKVEDGVKTTLNNPETVKEKMNKLSEEEQVSILGWKSSIAYTVVNNNNSVNLGYLGYESEGFAQVVASYLAKVNVTELPENFIIK